MDHSRLNAIQSYLERHALALDVALYAFYFLDGSAQNVLKKLAAYQNKDGGFCGSLEHDARLPQSTAIATWTGLRILHEIGADKHNPLMRRALTYLVNSYDPQRKGWPIVCRQVDDYPHAPWWTYKTAMASFGWGNPSAELLGFLIKYGDAKNAGLVKTLQDTALTRLKELDESADFHEVLTFKGLYALAGNNLQKQLYTPIERLIKVSATLDTERWKTYSAPPLLFVNSPNDPFIKLFHKDILKSNLNFLVQSLAGDHWEPNWDWQGAYPKAWQEAKREWAGQMTVKNLVLLKNFGMIKN